MRKIFLLITLLFLPYISFANYEILEKKIDNFLENKTEKKQLEILNKIDNEISKIQDAEKNEKLFFLKKLVIKKSLKLKETLETQEIIIWYSNNNLPIKAYYRWDINKSFFWIFANIHWGYEYWTYNTAIYLKEILDNSDKTQRFIIPTINPDWLELAIKNNFSKNFYLEWRSNKNLVDLNRNFCTPDWQWWNFIKKSLWLVKEDITLSIWEYCLDQKETQVIDEVLQKYKFSEIIDLHSKWWIIFLPDNSIEDYKVINLWNRVKSILSKDYIFNPYYETEEQKLKKIKIYEINERFTNSYWWSMVSYIYLKYNLPTIILELKEHWKIEYGLQNIIKIF